ncbi:hypothetical protein HIM_10012 [Hirsutella minnesotensis 3608]|uniref:Uncharacterized protein n=1 Tax=Hirsutella minnesotensis 3608 TaxID=1043627 RepID=A0A0F7ZS17_9HYPO|nr:hypothetical protein HIM_10012 [Hirsutella minnesotensis 3608]
MELKIEQHGSGQTASESPSDANDASKQCGQACSPADACLGLRQGMDSILEQLREMHDKMEAMHCRMTAAERNAVARIENGNSMHLQSPLVPLHSVQTGDEIAACPKTLEELDNMAAAHVDGILRQLGSSTEGDEEDRRRRLFLELGVAKRAV